MDRKHVTEERLPPFSEAYSNGLVINEDNDFFADELEDLLDLSLAFAGVFSFVRNHKDRRIGAHELWN